MRNEKGQFMKGLIPWNKGKELSDEQKEKVRVSTIKAMEKLSEEKKSDIIKTQFKRKEKHPNWQGGKESYYHNEARRIMENFLNRRLSQGETIHHKDGNHKNNKISNLTLFNNNSEHVKFHWNLQEENNINGRMKKLNEFCVPMENPK